MGDRERAVRSMRLSPERFAMIDDMAPLKKAMEEMDAEDPVEAQAAKDRAAQTLSDANMNFAKMAELIERRRLLLRPRIVAGIKRMDQPGMLGDAAFRDAGSALRREGQSFRQIAEAIELNSGPASQYEDPAQRSEPLRQAANELPYGMPNEPPYGMPNEPLYGMPGDLRMPVWLRVLGLVAGIVFFPFRHPIRFLTLAFVAFLLFYALRGIIGFGQPVTGHPESVATARRGADGVMSSVSSFINEQILRRPKESAAVPTPSPVPIPSPSAAAPSVPSANQPAAPSTAQAPPVTVPAPSANAPAAPLAPPSAPPAPSSAAPACPSGASPCREVRREPHSRTATNCCVPQEDRAPRPARRAPLEDGRPLTFDEFIPEAIRRNSRVAGPCVAGVGGCAWGGGRY
jgi:hypothetical protein